MKVCSKCKEEKDCSQFGKDKRAKSGLQSLCKSCNVERWAQYRKKYPERVKKSNKKWYQNNIDNRKQYNQELRKTPKARYKVHCKGAKKRGFLNDIDFDRFILITSQPCAYCGETESLRGLDRVYNDFPYTIDNVVSCCKPCNFAKHTKDFDEYISRCKRVAEKHG